MGGKAIADMNMSHIANVLGMTQQLQTAFVMSFGCLMIACGKLPRLLIPSYLSQRSFTSISNYLTVAAMTIWGSIPNISTYWFGLLLLGGSMERRTAASAMVTDLAVASGCGKGEYAAASANWR